MLNNEFVTRLVAELEAVKLDITAKPLTASQLWDKSYEYVIKRALGYNRPNFQLGHLYQFL